MSRSSLSPATITDDEHVDQIVTVQSARMRHHKSIVREGRGDRRLLIKRLRPENSVPSCDQVGNWLAPPS
jgi:hypothetical protein